MSDNSRAALLALVSVALMSLAWAVTKAAVAEFHVLQVLLFRQAIVLASTLPEIRKGFPESLKTRQPVLHGIRLIGAFVGLVGSIWAVALLPLTTATTLGFSQTFFMAILAVLFLGEHVGLHRIGAIVVGFIGVLIVIRPGSEGIETLGVVVAIAGAMGAAVAFTSVKRLSQTESTATLLAYQTIAIGTVAALSMIWVWKAPDAGGLMLLMGVGLLSAPAQWIGVTAVRLGESSLLANIQYSKLIYAGILGYLFFNEIPDRYTVLGAAVIVASAFYIFRREAKRARLTGGYDPHR